MGWEQTAPEAVREQSHIPPFLLAPQKGSQSGHHKIQLYKEQWVSVKAMGQSLTYLDPSQRGQSSRKLGATAELGAPHKAFSRLLEMATVMLQLKCRKTWDRGAGAMGHGECRDNVQCRGGD